MTLENSAHLGSADRSFGLTITDLPKLPPDSPYPYNRMETRIDVDLSGEYGAVSRGVRLEIVDDLFALIDGLTAFSKRERNDVSWSTSGGAIELELRWNSSLDVRCRVRVGAVYSDREDDRVMRREDAFEIYELTFVIVLAQIDLFLEELNAIALLYPQY